MNKKVQMLLSLGPVHEDLHLRTALKVFKVSEQAVTKEQRKVAKALNASFLYSVFPERNAR